MSSKPQPKPSSASNPSPSDERNKQTTVRIDVITHSALAAYAGRFQLTQSDTILLALSALKDRSDTGYAVENAFLLREIQALEVVTHQLVLSNLSLAETVFGLEGSALRSLLSLAKLARLEILDGKDRS